MPYSGLRDVVESILRQPTPAALVALQGAVLMGGKEGEAAQRALEIAGQFHSYLCELESKVAAKDYSEWASRLDMGAVGMVAVENLVATKPEELWERLILGGLGEGLMVAASRQYVKAWQVETGLVHRSAAWYLAQALWDLSTETQPNLPPGDRWRTVQSLLAPAHDPEVSAADKALLLGRVFQMLLLTYLARLLAAEDGGR